MTTAVNVRSTSKAVAFLLAAHNAMPRTLGDRTRVKAMSGVMQTAIECRMAFEPNDGEVIEKARMGIETCVGVFRPLSNEYYLSAVIAGGTFARMWERKNSVKPFIAPQAWSGESAELPRVGERFGPGLAIILPFGNDEADDLERTQEGGIWWCTSIDFKRDRLVLCRYRGNGVARQPHRGYESETRRPLRRLSLSRSEWNEAAKSILIEGRAAA